MKEKYLPAWAPGIATLLTLTACQEKEQVPTGQLPNIIFIYADDMGYGDLGCYGSRVNSTPNIDRMAAEGIRFTDFYSASTVSSPSRAGLLTGRYPVRMGVNTVFHPGSFTGLDTAEVTIPEILRKAGYRTGMVGKWHLGHMPQFSPLEQGFEEYYGIPYSNDMSPVLYLEGKKPILEIVNQDSITYNYTVRAQDYIRRRKDGPFFLYLAHHMPHIPLAASENFRGKSANGLYGDVMTELDWGVGEILRTLKEEGIDDNTIVVFASDNGPWILEGPLGGVPDPYFQGKQTHWEGGQRVPAICRWPEKIKAGSVYSDPANMTDWFTTFASIVRQRVPDDRVIDGKDLTLVLTGEGKRADDDFAFIAESGKVVAYRSGDWKMMMPAGEYRGNFWVADIPAHDTLLINLRNDPREQHNLIRQYPQVAQEMAAKMDAFKETLADCPPSLPHLFDYMWGAVELTNRQREDALREAKGKGVPPQSRYYSTE